MTVERGHQSVYFKDPQVIQGLEDIAKEAGGGVSVSAIINEVMGKALPDLVKSIKKGKRTGIPLSITIDL